MARSKSATRTSPTLNHERELYRAGFKFVAGVDEVGRGCLAGPVVAAAVILPMDIDLPGVQDSKTLTANQRDRLLDDIRTRAIAIGTGWCSPAEIDEMNILKASLEAMRRAVTALEPHPGFLLIDGNQTFSNPPCPCRTVIKGDAHSLSIAAASIVAKVTRDREMQRLHQEFPVYGWASHKGYPTRTHYEALVKYGPSLHHRRSFRLIPRTPVDPQLNLFDS